MHFSLRRTSKTRISGTATARAFIPTLAILLISQETSPPPHPPLKQLTGSGYGAVLYAAAGPWDPEADT